MTHFIVISCFKILAGLLYVFLLTLLRRLLFTLFSPEYHHQYTLFLLLPSECISFAPGEFKIALDCFTIPKTTQIKLAPRPVLFPIYCITTNRLRLLSFCKNFQPIVFFSVFFFFLAFSFLFLCSGFVFFYVSFFTLSWLRMLWELFPSFSAFFSPLV